MRILIVRTVPGEILLSKITYNEQYIGLARALIKAGHQCDIICGEENGVRTEKVYVENDNFIKIYFVKATTILKNNILHFDIIQAIEYNQIYTWHLAKECNGKYIVYHGPYYNKFNKRYNIMAKAFDMLFTRRYIKLKTSFITKSEYAADYLKKKGIKNVHSVGVGIDIQSFNREIDLYDPFYDKIKSFNVDLKLLYIGRIEPRRNSLFLLKVLKSVRDHGCNAGLIIIGKGNNEYLNNLKNEAHNLNLDNFILYKSALEQKFLPEIYRLSDFFLLPTIYDIYGMVILEAMYFGIPLISAPCGGTQMMIKSGENGIVIDNFDEIEWSDNIIRLSNDRNKCDNMARLAQNTVMSRFTWDALVDKILMSYKDAITK